MVPGSGGLLGTRRQLRKIHLHLGESYPTRLYRRGKSGQRGGLPQARGGEQGKDTLVPGKPAGATGISSQCS